MLLKKVLILNKCASLDSTLQTPSGEVSGLQTSLPHLSPHVKYINCWNPRLDFIFVHLLKENESLRNVDTLLLLMWKMMEYSSVNCAVFNVTHEIGFLPCAITFFKKKVTYIYG